MPSLVGSEMCIRDSPSPPCGWQIHYGGLHCPNCPTPPASSPIWHCHQRRRYLARGVREHGIIKTKIFFFRSFGGREARSTLTSCRKSFQARNRQHDVSGVCVALETAIATVAVTAKNECRAGFVGESCCELRVGSRKSLDEQSIDAPQLHLRPDI